jgi:hypothetical protein
MKKLILFLCFAIMCIAAGSAIAQDKAKISITSVKQKDKNVNFTVTASKPFRMGGNVYVLLIGDKEFAHGKQSKPNGKGVMTIFIPADEFNDLSEGANIYLTYGHKYRGDEQAIADLSKQGRSQCWSLGKFSKKLLTK